MKIYTKIDFKAYLKFQLYLSYFKTTNLLIFIIALGLLASFFLWKLNIISLSNPYFNLFMGIWILIIIPLYFYYIIRKNYLSNKRLQENMIYEFSEDMIRIKGESFESTMDWQKIHKIIEFKNWILIYQNTNIANFIPKNSFGNYLQDFRTLVLKNKVKSKLFK